MFPSISLANALKIFYSTLPRIQITLKVFIVASNAKEGFNKAKQRIKVTFY